MTSLRADDSCLKTSDLCELFGRTKQAYYKSVSQKCEKESNDDLIVLLAKDIRKDMPMIGAKKIHHMIKTNYGLAVGRDHLFELMRNNGMLSCKRKKRCKTTYSGHGLYTYPNAVSDIVPTRPNEIWVSDITYIFFGDKFRYLFLITDAYSKKIIGWVYSETMQAENAIAALKMAIKQRTGCEPLIHHSDRGAQYCASQYIALQKQYGIQPSMTENSDPRENGIAERVNGILKQEFLDPLKLTPTNAKRMIAKAIDTYNNKRPHLSLGMHTPSEAHTMTGNQTRLWKTNYKSHKTQENCLPLPTQTTRTTTI